MTMTEIDRLRGHANEALEKYRVTRIRAKWAPWPTAEVWGAEFDLVEARMAVEDALREWWAQGCRETAAERDRTKGAA